MEARDLRTNLGIMKQDIVTQVINLIFSGFPCTALTSSYLGQPVKKEKKSRGAA